MGEISKYKFGEGRLLVVLGADAPLTRPPPVEQDHVFCVDVSGSMSSELALVREHVKNRIPMVVRPGDTLSMIAFSGRGQVYPIFTALPIQNLQSLAAVHDAIDRLLRPIGLTGFKEPLDKCAETFEELKKKRPNALRNLVFMSDGCDNQWSRQQILDSVDKLVGKFQDASFIEYGYYADRPMLTAMAEKFGGKVIFAEDFPGYVPAIETSLKSSGSGRFERMRMPMPVIDGFVFGMDSQNQLRVYKVEADGSVMVPIGDDGKPSLDMAFVSSMQGTEDEGRLSELCQSGTDPKLTMVYAALSAYAHRMRGDRVRELLSSVGDVELLTEFSTCFGKQRFSEFSEAALDKAGTPPKRFRMGFNLGYQVREDMPTLLDLFSTLSELDATLMLDHASFRYDRIGRKAVDLDPATLRFKADGAEGYPIAGITLNEKRPNISVRVMKKGQVMLDVPGKPRGLPSSIGSFQYRNYALVKDAIVHVDLLPVRLSGESYDKLKAMKIYPDLPIKGVSTDDSDGFVLTFDLKKLALCNHKSVRAPSALELLSIEYELVRSRIEQKVYKHFAGEEPKNVQIGRSFEALFGKEGAEWLRDKGVTEQGGYAPKQVLAEATDVYKGVELQTGLKGLKSLPPVDELLERLKNGKKLTTAMELMKPSVLMAQKHDRAWAAGMAKASIAETRRLLYKIATLKYALVVGQTWFADAPEPGTWEGTVTFDERSYEASINLVDVEIEV